MKLDVNLNDVETGEFDLFPVDSYEIEVIKWKQDKSEAGPFIRWTLKPIGDLPKGNFGNLFLRTWLHAEALWNLKRFLEALQFEWDEDGFDPDDVVGCTCLVQVTHTTDEKTGRVFANVEPNYVALK